MMFMRFNQLFKVYVPVNLFGILGFVLIIVGQLGFILIIGGHIGVCIDNWGACNGYSTIGRV